MLQNAKRGANMRMGKEWGRPGGEGSLTPCPREVLFFSFSYKNNALEMMHVNHHRIG